ARPASTSSPWSTSRVSLGHRRRGATWPRSAGSQWTPSRGDRLVFHPSSGRCGSTYARARRGRSGAHAGRAESAERPFRGVASVQLGVVVEVLGQRRTPAIERVLLREIARLPGAVLGDGI